MKMRNAFHLVLAISAVFFLSRCYYDQILEPISTLPDKDVSFKDDIIPIFNTDCNMSGCHNTGGTAPDLTPLKAYDALKLGNYINIENPKDSELYKWMANQRQLSMPLSGPNTTNNAMVLQWITQGALNN